MIYAVAQIYSLEQTNIHVRLSRQIFLIIFAHNNNNIYQWTTLLVEISRNFFLLLVTGNNNMRGGYNNQRYNQQRQTFAAAGPPQASSPNMYHAVPPQAYMMQAAPPPGTDGMQSIINHKFFQGNRLPSTQNPCSYQSMGQGQTGPYSQFPGPLQFTYPYAQQPTAAVQQ